MLEEEKNTYFYMLNYRCPAIFCKDFLLKIQKISKILLPQSLQQGRFIRNSFKNKQLQRIMLPVLM